MDSESLKYIAVGLMALGMLGSALGVGNIFASAVEAMARNPSAEKQILKFAVIGAGLSEAMGLFSLLIVLVILFG